MVRLTNVRQRITCAYCGAREVYSFDAAEDQHAILSVAALKAGWLRLDGTGMCLCSRHAGTVQHATLDEVKFLGARLAAFGTAHRVGLAFIVLGERLISETDERRATAAEIAMWQVIAGAFRTVEEV